ncbi:MAG: hypothetical protein RQ722_12295 [Desulfuromonadales bacterium]|nr:hypothetical protein [Desulfuromonadales bacterium]
MKIRFEDRTQDIMNGLLADPVGYDGDAQWPLLFAPRLVDVAPLDRFAAIGVVDEPMAQGTEMLLLFLRPRRYAHTVDSTAALVLHHFVRGVRQVVPVVDLVDRTVKDSLHLTPLLRQNGLCAGGAASRLRVVFAWNVPLSAVCILTILSRCRPSSWLDRPQLL